MLKLINDAFVISMVSHNFAHLNDKSGLTINMFAVQCDLNPSTFKNYLYGKSVASLHTIMTICNRYSISVNEFFKDALDYPTEQSSILRVKNSFESIPGIKRMRAYRLIEPFIIGMFNGTPTLADVGFGSRLRIVREDLPYTTEELAVKCAIAEDTLRVLESSQRLPGVSVFLNLAQGLGVSPEYLLCNHTNVFSLGLDKRLYNLTPRQLLMFAESSERICNNFNE